MRIAIVSDLHANIQAWNAALFDIRSQRVDQIVCLGDIVGYGPNPAEVLQSVHANVELLVLGNHDAVVAEKIGDDLFNDKAQALIRWTRTRLNSQAVKFLSSLPLSIDTGEFRCAHADLSDPAAYHYVIEPGDAIASWETVGHQLLFVGHTHKPGIFLMGPSETPHAIDPRDFRLEPHKRYLVNAGSVGHPRDGDARACYCILDTQKESLYWRRIPYDIDAFRAAVDREEFPREAFRFLENDPRDGVPPLREQLDFSPATSPNQSARDVVHLREVDIHRRHARRWRNRFIALFGTAAVAGAVMGGVVYEQSSRTAVITDTSAKPILPHSSPVGVNVLPSPKPHQSTRGAISGWNIMLGMRRRQRVEAIAMRDGSPAIAMSSEVPATPLAVYSPPVQVSGAAKFCAQAMVCRSPDFAGTLAVHLVETRDVAGRAQTMVRVMNPGLRRKDGWLEAKHTFITTTNAVSLEYRIEGSFTGSVVAAQLSLTCLEPPSIRLGR
jgi:predicted phosphodiesterase